ncbi:TIGR03619 family F420-dependent LLM class oxidoreductase [Dactylosporangium vinaceum]|uniref:TIGR03619 family F420-dependent LLM class oxidoreductase n=1 Tax=Dactylosporangium vinaceum TaxID=53362 RepID=A0ABV5MEK9_9ACTN|nr:TIGR03619 family F420-dependent LLM class oxidoreductase [Dactylosporangium vinaceum]UAB92378.1 TIGR03619 family F420-dependent LLM class oxidoreductase [Dactylosporangium vinaceum]
MALRVGIGLPQLKHFDARTAVTRAARAAEEIGYDSVWVFERFLRPQDQGGPHGLYQMPDVPWPVRYGGVLDPLVALTLAAAVTERVELGTCVLIAPLHVPARLARSLASLDAVSGGRLVAGLGAGWSIDEFAALAPRPVTERGAALDEFLDVAAAIWGPDPVAYRNDRWTVAPAEIGPKPARRIPVYLGGFADAALRRIARRGDGWLPTGLPPAAAGATLARIRAMAADAGRDPSTVSCTFQVGLDGTLDPVPEADRRPYTGSIDQIVEDIAALETAGVDHVFLTVSNVVTDLDAYVDTAAAFHAALEAAGLTTPPAAR